MGSEAEQDLKQRLDNLLSNGNKQYHSAFIFNIYCIHSRFIFKQLDPTKSSTKVPFDSIEVFLEFVQTNSNIPNVRFIVKLFPFSIPVIISNRNLQMLFVTFMDCQPSKRQKITSGLILN